MNVINLRIATQAKHIISNVRYTLLRNTGS